MHSNTLTDSHFSAPSCPVPHSISIAVSQRRAVDDTRCRYYVHVFLGTLLTPRDALTNSNSQAVLISSLSRFPCRDQASVSARMVWTTHWSHPS